MHVGRRASSLTYAISLCVTKNDHFLSFELAVGRLWPNDDDEEDAGYEGQKSSRIKILHSRDFFVLAIFMQQQMKPYCSGRFICARFISSQSKSWLVKEQLL